MTSSTTSGSNSEAPPRQSSYGQIVKSSSIMGGVAAISLVFGMVRTKFAAILIGTVGAGLLANFVAVQSVLTNLAGLGIGSSAVRDVARAYAKEDDEEIGRAVLTLRRSCWITGLAGALAMGLLSPWISRLTFGNTDYAWHFAALGLTVLLSNLQGGQTALIQGTRRIGELARLQLGAAVGGTVVSVLLYFWLGVAGLVPALVLMSMTNYGIAHYYSRQVPVPSVQMSFRDSFHAAKGMARLGIAMMWSSLAASAAAYGINAVITHQVGLHALGIYSAGFALSGMFANFVLNAMGSDYYPRLASVSDDDPAINRLVNEQTEVGLLLAVPGLVATLTLAPWVIHIFYTREFLPAVALLHWFTLGCLGRVISWPIGYLLMAKSRSAWMVACETTIQITHVLLVYAGIHFLGLPGAGIAFALLYAIYTAMLLVVARRVTGFSWNVTCARQIGLSVAFILLGWLIAQIDSRELSTVLGVLCIVAAGLHSIRGLAARLGQDHALSRTLHRLPGLGWIVAAGPQKS